MTLMDFDFHIHAADPAFINQNTGVIALDCDGFPHDWFEGSDPNTACSYLLMTLRTA
ncbi:hypothetical protein [Klebsiella pneumoniae]